MKRILKSLMACVCVFVMVLATGITAFASESSEVPDKPQEQVFRYGSTITVHGLADQEETTVKWYQIISLDQNENKWEVADWAKDYVKLGEAGKYELGNLAELAGKIQAEPTGSIKATGTTASFKAEVGGYLIIATGSKATYSPMFANTYDEKDDYMASKDVDVYAKTSGYTVDKSADDHLVYRGETVTFTVKTTYPTFDNPKAAGNSYTIVDTPTGLNITGVTSVKIGGEAITDVTGAYEGNDYKIDLSKTIGDSNKNAGKTVEVKYTAVVTEEKGYHNTVNVYRGETKLGQDEEKGYEGDITITKKDTKGNTLKGAEFTVQKDNITLKFVKTEAGVYKLAKSSDEAGCTETIEATEGTVTIQGLDEGTYHFTETKAPKGYSINESGVNVTVDDKTVDKNVSLTGTLTDSKLSSLPSTGGMGTYIFTIAGIAIMSIAAGVLFLKKKKAN